MAKKVEIKKPVFITSTSIQLLSVQQQIFLIRGKQVMVDRDLAALYGVETRILKQAVKRNMERFPEEFMFQLDNQEFEKWRSQFVIPLMPNGKRKPWRRKGQGKNEIID